MVAVGRFTWQKGFDILLTAFRIVVDGDPKAKLIILGDGPLRPTLEGLIGSLRLAQNVDLPGFVENPWSYVARGTVFAMSSRFEGMPLALIEALACGVPVVSTDCPSGPVEILEQGRLGTLVPVGDARRLAAGLNNAIADPPPPVDLTYLEGLYAPEQIATRFLDAIAACHR